MVTLLCQNSLDAPFSRSFVASPALAGRQQLWSVAEFLGQVNCLAQQLPNARYVTNLCENRYLFSLSFCAALVRGQTSLLPQNRATATQKNLLDSYLDNYILHDGCGAIVPGAQALNLNQLNLLAASAEKAPAIDLDFLAAIAFTSGSTGVPSPNLKTWRTLVESSRINARYMLPKSRKPLAMLATVPPQHMWGLETSVLLPLFNPICIADSKPLFPKDVVERLHGLPVDRMLVSTPIHLRALVRSGLELPKVERIVCATAPLPRELAVEIEQAFAGELIEVYGCSEAGSMAWRRTAVQHTWTLFDGLDFIHGSPAQVVGEHLPCAVSLSDSLAFTSDREFTLQGRGDDMLEVAGKRGSLQELNKLLLCAPGVADGVVFTLHPPESGVMRPVAFVVAGAQFDRQRVAAHIAAHVDPVFVPRPILVVDTLPREDSGKLQRGNLLSLWHELQSRTE